MLCVLLCQVGAVNRSALQTLQNIATFRKHIAITSLEVAFDIDAKFVAYGKSV